MSKIADNKVILEADWLYKKYERDPTERGRSLELAWILGQLKKDDKFAQFEPILREAINEIREYGSTDDRKRERVIKALKSYASEVAEIAEETRILKEDVQKICEQLTKENLVRHDYRTHSNSLGDHKVDLFFWRANDEKYN